ncbi:hypothetical protein AKJ09_10128 [Labilithrix luteola]|uniref:Tetratricopeptide repeat protein n=1 Tax=Labilithrix luteola TaxID=1391654 RepID=A0A0K1QDF7_9BACT|nr:hypothetical protein [Labilithrix luteola]AKV03465.1 hypothetical protein AKJ09_10128 [Labilithrix luteola]
MAPSQDTDDELSYEDEIALVNELTSAGVRFHALTHCITALALEPNRQEWRAHLADLLADEKLRRALEEDTFLGAHAARAYWLHRNGKLGEAIEIVAQLQHGAPHAGFAPWLARWCEEAAAGKLRVDPTLLVQACMPAMSLGLGRMTFLPAEQAAAEELVPVILLARSQAPGDVRTALVASAILRRAGRLDDALDATAAVETSARGGKFVAMAEATRGFVLRALRRFDEALTCFDRAFEAEGDPVHRLEQFRVLVDAGRWNDALARLEVYRGLTELEAEEEIAFELVTALESAGAPPPVEPPLDLVRRRILGHGLLVQMGDVMGNSARRIGASLRDGATANTVVDKEALPSPELDEWITSISEYDEREFEPSSDFLDLWSAASMLRPPAENAHAWVSAFLHPRMPNTRMTPGPIAIHRWQVVAMIGLALSETGWAGTEKRTVLLALLRGPMDGSLGAVIRVAAEVALHEPLATKEIRDRLLELVELFEAEASGALLRTLRIALDMLPFTPRDVIERLADADVD